MGALDTEGRRARAGHRRCADPQGDDRQRAQGQAGRADGKRAGGVPAPDAASDGSG